MKTWAFPDSRPPGAGPWSEEPDKAQWIDEATGLDCLVVRSPNGGNLCGYVGVPPTHPLHGVGGDDDAVQELDCHGGITFASSCQEGDPEAQIVCHVPEPGRPGDVWWFGFDCAHYMDLLPTMWARMVSSMPDFVAGTTYRDFAYVQDQVRILALQLAVLREAQG